MPANVARFLGRDSGIVGEGRRSGKGEAWIGVCASPDSACFTARIGCSGRPPDSTIAAWLRQACSSGRPEQRLLLRLHGGWQAGLKAVVDGLIRFAEGDDLIRYLFGRRALDKHAGNEVGDGAHLSLPHAKPGDFGRADAQAAWVIPLLCAVAGYQILVGYDIRAGKPLGDL